MTQLTPYLTCNGNCRDVMAFYQACLGGELAMQMVKDSPMAAQWPAGVQEHILHASLIKEQLIILASDMGSTEERVNGNTLSLALLCSSEEEIKIIFSRLSQEGNVTHPLHTFFDGSIGALTDKFGINWLLKR